MTDEQRTLIELELCNALRTFHDLEDKKQGAAYSKQYFWSFCERYELDPRETFAVVEKVLKEKSRHSYSDYSDSIKLLDNDIKAKDPDERD